MVTAVRPKRELLSGMSGFSLIQHLCTHTLGKIAVDQADLAGTNLVARIWSASPSDQLPQLAILTSASADLTSALAEQNRHPLVVIIGRDPSAVFI